MDQALLSTLMKSYGAADTPENSNRIREFYASDPTAADRRAYGVKGQSHEGGADRDAILNAMIDKVAAPAPAAITQEPLAPLPMVQNATAPTRRSATAGAPQRGPRGTAPSMEPQMQPGYSDTNAQTSPAIGAPGSRVSGYETNVEDQTLPANGGGILDWLLPAILGISALRSGAGGAAPSPSGVPSVRPIPDATYVGPMGREGAPPVAGRISNEQRRPVKASPRAIGNDGKLIEGANPSQKRVGSTPKLEDNISDLTRVPTNEPPPTQVRNSPQLENEGKKRQLQAEVDAENEGASRLQKQMTDRAMAQKNTADLAKAARRATGRK